MTNFDNASDHGPEPGLVTRVLESLSDDPAASEQLMPLVYQELRRLAAARMREERPEHTLQPTALVHEAYMRLVGDSARDKWDSRSHFFAAAAEAMRRILIENARRKQRIKHGGELQRVTLDAHDVAAVPESKEDLLELDGALTAFAQNSPDKAALVNLRYFAGLNEADAADVLGISRATASRWWAYSRAWLLDYMNRGRVSGS